jgi:hypothetical protein
MVNDRDLTDAAAKMEQHLTGVGILSGIQTAGDEKEPRAKKPITPLQ